MEKIHKAVEKYVESFYVYHDHLRTRSMRFRVPIIVLSALTTGVSFVNVTILSRYMSVIAGSMTLVVTILTAIEGYLKLPQHMNATENTLKSLGILSRKIHTYMMTNFEPTPELIAGIWNELGDAIKDAPIIPFHTLEQLQPLAKKRMIYSMFDDIATQKESEERFYPAFRTQNV